VDVPSWTVHPEAEALVHRGLRDAVGASPALRDLVGRLGAETSTGLTDWLDHVVMPVAPDELGEVGYAPAGEGLWRHPRAQLPAVAPGRERVVALAVDDAAAFAAIHHARGPVEGAPLGPLRRVEAWRDGGVALVAVERRSWSVGITPAAPQAAAMAAAVEARDAWARRRRHLPRDEGLAEAMEAAREGVALVGPDLASAFALEVEREHWQRRNHAAQLQHGRQERLGLGWGNRDHHTFRSGRTAFHGALEVFAELGFRPRERFWAGAEAGWGAQVLEHPGTGAVLFVDVDLEPDEAGIDFTAAPLPPSGRLGTVGLWCALHGESILGAGMHHLEGQFDFDRLRDDLGVPFMPPFSDLPHLRQAFTAAERWPVDRAVLDALRRAGHLDDEQARRLLVEGAPGSHLESLARRGGFKGFNQRNVSLTMRATDPRRYGAAVS
jgi:hypothetical protein